MVVKVVFKNGDRTYKMKATKLNKDGSAVLIDGSTIDKEDIIEIIKEKDNLNKNKKK